MKTKLTKRVENGFEWSIMISGYDVFECEDTLVSFLNEAGCKTYLNKKGEVIACCATDNVVNFMHKAEKLYNKFNSELM